MRRHKTKAIQNQGKERGKKQSPDARQRPSWHITKLGKKTSLKIQERMGKRVFGWGYLHTTPIFNAESASTRRVFQLGNSSLFSNMSKRVANTKPLKIGVKEESLQSPTPING